MNQMDLNYLFGGQWLWLGASYYFLFQVYLAFYNQPRKYLLTLAVDKTASATHINKYLNVYMIRMQVNPLFGHITIITIPVEPEQRCHIVTKIFWSALVSFILLNLVGVLIAYLVTKTFDGWYTITCICTTIIGCIFFIVCCIRSCCCATAPPEPRG